MIDMRSKEPIHKLIYDDISNKIKNEFYKTGDLLPSEIELEKLFKVSRTPIRQAMKQLEIDGLIYRQQGKGSFVANYQALGQWTTMTGFKDLYKKEWKKISARTIEVSQIKSFPYANLLEINADEEVIHLKRVRYFNGEPVIYLEHYLPSELPLEIFQNDPTFISIDHLLNEKQNINFTLIKEELEAVSADQNVANLLKVTEGTPVLKSIRISYNYLSKPIDVTVSFLQSEKWKYRIQFSK